MAQMKTLTLNGKTYTVTDPAAANALRGTVTGNPVCITDCSPVEHEMEVKADAPGATVTKYGKNLVDMSDWVKQGAATIAEDGSYKIVTLAMHNKYGEDSGSGIYVPVNGNIPIVISGTVKTASPDSINYCFIVYIMYTDGTYTRLNWGGKFTDGIAQWVTKTATSDPSKTITRVNYIWTSDAAYVKDFQIEVGETATDYEPYVAPVTYIADENGKVSGVTSLNPTTTLIADSDAIITAEYNKDTNKVIENLVSAIISLGGNV